MKLKREIGFYDAILLVINSIVGTGIFFVPQITAKLLGIYSYLSWILFGIFSILYSFIIADFIHRYPKAGGVYEYVKESFGSFLGFIAGWIEILATWTIISMILRISSDALSKIFKIEAWILIILFVVLFHILTYLGIKISKYTLLLFSFWTLFTLIFIIYYLLNLKDGNINYVGNFSVPLFLLACFYTFEAYAGWENISFLSEEAKNPKRDIPIALLIGNFITVLFYLIISFLIIFTYITYGEVYGIGTLGKKALLFVSIQALGTVFAWTVAIPRLLYALGRDKLLPEIFSKLDKKTKTPVYSIIFQFIFILFFSLTGTFEKILNLVTPTIAILYFLISFSYLKLRAERAFISLFLKSIAILSLFIFIFILAIGKLASIVSILLILSLIPLYIGIQIHEKKEITKSIHNIFANIIDITREFWKKEKYMYDIFFYLYPLKDKKILDFGCSTGKLSIFLAKEEPECIVYASDISKRELEILKKKMKSMKIGNIIPVLDKKDRISVKDLDAVCSIGGLAYVIDLDTFLKDLNNSLKKKGKFIFIEFDKIFRIFNAPRWLSDFEYVKRKFREFGFYIEIKRERERFWDTIYIYGFKIKDLSK